MTPKPVEDALAKANDVELTVIHRRVLDVVVERGLMTESYASQATFAAKNAAKEAFRRATQGPAK